MKRISTENRKKLKYFMEQQENMMAIITLLSLISYLILMGIFKKGIILLIGYVFCYFSYTKLYKWLYFKLFRNDCK